ncbi:MAG: hypothetical protein MJB57_15860 [Gemmatimonadetes bacterium]|nr:hypothetical protein [Gemmatimonadota bacterium]
MLGLAISSGTDAIRMQSGRTRLDARRFEEAALAGDHESALAYYHGRFAPGLARCATRDFEEWCERERTRYHCLAHISFGALCDRYSRDDPPEALLHFAHSWVRRFPTDDVAQQRFAEALDRAGERRGAAAVEALLRSS